MYENLIELTNHQIQQVCQAVAQLNLRRVYFVACGGSLATLYPGKYLLERLTDQIYAETYNAAEFLCTPPAALDSNTLVVFNSQSGSTPETIKAAQLAADCGALTVAFTVMPDSPLDQIAAHTIYYYDDPLHPFPAVLTIFPEIYKLTWALLDILNHSNTLPSVNTAMNMLQHTFDTACAQHISAARTFAQTHHSESLLYTVSSGLDACIGYIMTNCLIMESLWKHSSALHAGEFFHGAFEAIDSSSPVLALLGLGPNRQIEERAVKFLLRKTSKLVVIDAASIDLSAYPAFLREPIAALVLNRLCALYVEEMSFVLGHPISSRRYMGVEKY